MFANAQSFDCNFRVKRRWTQYDDEIDVFSKQDIVHVVCGERNGKFFGHHSSLLLIVAPQSFDMKSLIIKIAVY